MTTKGPKPISYKEARAAIEKFSTALFPSASKQAIAERLLGVLPQDISRYSKEQLTLLVNQVNSTSKQKENLKQGTDLEMLIVTLVTAINTELQQATRNEMAVRAAATPPQTEIKTETKSETNVVFHESSPTFISEEPSQQLLENVKSEFNQALSKWDSTAVETKGSQEQQAAGQARSVLALWEQILQKLGVSANMATHQKLVGIQRESILAASQKNDSFYSFSKILTKHLLGQQADNNPFDIPLEKVSKISKNPFDISEEAPQKISEQDQNALRRTFWKKLQQWHPSRIETKSSTQEKLSEHISAIENLWNAALSEHSLENQGENPDLLRIQEDCLMKGTQQLRWPAELTTILLQKITRHPSIAIQAQPTRFPVPERPPTPTTQERIKESIARLQTVRTALKPYMRVQAEEEAPDMDLDKWSLEAKIPDEDPWHVRVRNSLKSAFESDIATEQEIAANIDFTLERLSKEATKEDTLESLYDLKTEIQEAIKSNKTSRPIGGITIHGIGELGKILQTLEKEIEIVITDLDNTQYAIDEEASDNELSKKEKTIVRKAKNIVYPFFLEKINPDGEIEILNQNKAKLNF